MVKFHILWYINYDTTNLYSRNPRKSRAWLWFMLLVQWMCFTKGCYVQYIYPTVYKDWCIKEVNITKDEVTKIVLKDSNKNVKSGGLIACRMLFVPATGEEGLCVNIDTYFTTTFGDYAFIVKNLGVGDENWKDYRFEEATHEDFRSLNYTREVCTSSDDGILVYFQAMASLPQKAPILNMSLAVKTVTNLYRHAYFIAPCQSEILISDSFFLIQNRPKLSMPINVRYGEGLNPLLTSDCLYTAVNKDANRSICLAFFSYGESKCQSKWTIVFQVPGSERSNLTRYVDCEWQHGTPDEWCYPPEIEKVKIVFKRIPLSLRDVETEKPESFELVISGQVTDNTDTFRKRLEQEFRAERRKSSGACGEYVYSRTLDNETSWSKQERRLRDDRWSDTSKWLLVGVASLTLVTFAAVCLVNSRNFFDFQRLLSRNSRWE